MASSSKAFVSDNTKLAWCCMFGECITEVSSSSGRVEDGPLSDCPSIGASDTRASLSRNNWSA